MPATKFGWRAAPQAPLLDQRLLQRRLAAVLGQQHLEGDEPLEAAGAEGGGEEDLGDAAVAETADDAVGPDLLGDAHHG
jgi:hypothetical protein